MNEIMSIKIGNQFVGEDLPCYIIAEAGVNHNGSLEHAKKLIDKAVNAGADAIKFQTFKAENIASVYADKADYQKEVTSTDETQFEMLKKLELSETDFIELADYCAKKHITFLSSPFDHDSVDLLEKCNIQAYKIPSGELTNHPLLKKIAKTNKPVILSTGMSYLIEVQETVELLINNGCSSIALLHCTTSYPTPPEDVNLKAMQTLSHHLNLPVGYSDHTKGINIALAAVAIGGCIIEKHFTLDRNLPGPDHKASLEPDELKEMIRIIRENELAMGDGIKRPTHNEKKIMKIARKSIIAKIDLNEGEIINKRSIEVKRPGTGISPVNYDNVIGREIIRKVKKDMPITWEDVG